MAGRIAIGYDNPQEAFELAKTFNSHGGFWGFIDTHEFELGWGDSLDCQEIKNMLEPGDVFINQVKMHNPLSAIEWCLANGIHYVGGGIWYPNSNRTSERFNLFGLTGNGLPTCLTTVSQAPHLVKLGIERLAEICHIEVTDDHALMARQLDIRVIHHSEERMGGVLEVGRGTHEDQEFGQVAHPWMVDTRMIRPGNIEVKSWDREPIVAKLLPSYQAVSIMDYLTHYDESGEYRPTVRGMDKIDQRPDSVLLMSKIQTLWVGYKNTPVVSRFAHHQIVAAVEWILENPHEGVIDSWSLDSRAFTTMMADRLGDVEYLSTWWPGYLELQNREFDA